MSDLLNSLFPKGSARRFFAASIRKSPFLGWFSILRSIYCSYVLTGSVYPVKCLVGPRVPLIIERHPDSTVKLHGKLLVRSWGGGRNPASISMDRGAHLEIAGDFTVGHGVRLFLSRNAKLFLGGNLNGESSGITCNAMIMVENEMRIGKGCIIGWDCYLTDSDWHDILQENRQVERSLPVEVGDHVWIGHGCSILKGAVIGEESIVASRSVVLNGNYQAGALLAGSPAKLVRSHMKWRR